MGIETGNIIIITKEPGNIFTVSQASTMKAATKITVKSVYYADTELIIEP